MTSQQQLKIVQEMQRRAAERDLVTVQQLGLQRGMEHEAQSVGAHAKSVAKQKLTALHGQLISNDSLADDLAGRVGFSRDTNETTASLVARVLAAL
jgi:hypothetical protein